MREAVTAKANYSEETKKLNGHSNGIRELSPLSDDDDRSANTVNGETTGNVETTA